MTSYSGGIRWWLTRNIRASGGIIYEDYHDEVDFGSRVDDALLGFRARFQIDF